MHTSQIPQPRQDFQLEMLDGEIFLYDKVSTKAVYLNSSAALVWQLCDGQRSIKIIRKILQEAYPDKAETIIKDVDESLSLLKNERMIQLL